jgi:XTP/dITP diphosphohydrolase
MLQLLIATQNRGKMIEIQALLQDMPLEVIRPDQIGLDLKVEESGQTYAENAARKASAFAQAAGLLTLADDSGLEVDVLGGLPGLYSARFAPQPGATDADRRAYLLQRLSEFQPPWKAQFRCTIALSKPGGELLFAEGVCPGEIISEERGNNGFGYDPIFLIPEICLTMAELTTREKNRISHRSRAILAASRILTEMINELQ